MCRRNDQIELLDMNSKLILHNSLIEKKIIFTSLGGTTSTILQGLFKLSAAEMPIRHLATN